MTAFRAVSDFTPDHKQEQNSKNEIESGEPDQCEQNIASVQHAADALAGAE
jgi:hypothetical protein